MFYGWRVVSGVFIAQLFVTGFFTYAVSLLVAPVREEFGVSLEQVMYSLTFATILGLVVTPLAGWMIDKFPVRGLMISGAVIFSGGLWVLSYAESITEYVVVFGLTMSLANGLAGAMCGSAVIARWFTANRGRALGIGAMGTSVGGVAIPMLISYWLGEYGWRGALQHLSIAILLLMLPAIVLMVRGKPSDIGLHAEAQGEGSFTTQAPDKLLSPIDILKTPAYWYLGLSLGALFSAYSAVVANITPYAINLGHSEADASLLIVVIAVSGLIGKLLFGMAADKFSLKAGLWTAQGLVIVGFLLMVMEPGFSLLLVAAGAIGFAAGGMVPVWGAMMAQIFGLISFGKAMGLMGPLLTVCIVPGFTLIGRLVDTHGDYTFALLIFAITVFLGALLLLPLSLENPSQT
jgi:MFS family permease